MIQANAPSDAAPPAATKAPSPSPSAARWVVVVLLFVLVIFVVIAVLAAISTDGETWSRIAFIFSVLATLAASVVGWYFGSSIQEERVAQAEALAQRVTRDAENGRSLAALILAHEGRVVENDAGFTLIETERNIDQKLRREYADAARLLFPYALNRTRPTDELDAQDDHE